MKKWSPLNQVPSGINDFQRNIKRKGLSTVSGGYSDPLDDESQERFLGAGVNWGEKGQNVYDAINTITSLDNDEKIDAYEMAMLPLLFLPSPVGKQGLAGNLLSKVGGKFKQLGGWASDMVNKVRPWRTSGNRNVINHDLMPRFPVMFNKGGFKVGGGKVFPWHGGFPMMSRGRAPLGGSAYYNPNAKYALGALSGALGNWALSPTEDRSEGVDPYVLEQQKIEQDRLGSRNYMERNFDHTRPDLDLEQNRQNQIWFNQLINK